MSENEDTELEYAIMQKASAEAAFQASLKANSNIMQLSLANYI
jgi:flagellin-like hook-associated protein FlgL